VGYVADRVRLRGIFNIIFGLIACGGFTILIISREAPLSYGGVFLCAIGIYSCVANNTTWMSNNVEGVYKRGVAVGTIIAWGNLNGIMSSNVYRQADEPWYRSGHCVILGYLVVALVFGSILNIIFLSIGNRRRRVGGERFKREKLAGLDEEQIRELADFHPDFRYTL
jgi:hypothetical protein